MIELVQQVVALVLAGVVVWNLAGWMRRNR